MDNFLAMGGDLSAYVSLKEAYLDKDDPGEIGRSRQGPLISFLTFLFDAQPPFTFPARTGELDDLMRQWGRKKRAEANQPARPDVTLELPADFNEEDRQLATAIRQQDQEQLDETKIVLPWQTGMPLNSPDAWGQVLSSYEESGQTVYTVRNTQGTTLAMIESTEPNAKWVIGEDGQPLSLIGLTPITRATLDAQAQKPPAVSPLATTAGPVVASSGDEPEPAIALALRKATNGGQDTTAD